MNISYLGQGYEPESFNAVGNKLKSLFSDVRFSKFFCLSAFTRKAHTDDGIPFCKPRLSKRLSGASEKRARAISLGFELS